MMEEERQSHESSSNDQLGRWIDEQESLKRKLITRDDFPWALSAPESSSSALKYVGGVDMSFAKEDVHIACGSLVVLELPELQVVYQDFLLLRLHVPYVPGFLAFREAPVLLQLLDKMKKDGSPFYPQVLMVDGNGILHPRGFGLACHLGVLADLPTIGIGKNLHHVDGLTKSRVRQLLELEENRNEAVVTLKGNSGFTWGAGMRLSPGSLRPIYISVGHRLSLDTALKIVKMTCKYRVPEPIRQADMKSRGYLLKNQTSILEQIDCSN